MAFCSPKSCGGVGGDGGGYWLPFSFCQPCVIFRAIVPAWWYLRTWAYMQRWCYRFHSGLDERWKSDELMIWQSNTLIDNKIILHLRFIKPLTKREAMGLVCFLFSSAKSFCLVLDEDVNRCYSLCLYMLSSFHQNNKCRLCNLPYRIPADLQATTKTLNCWIEQITLWYIVKYILNNLSTKVYCPTNGYEKKRQGWSGITVCPFFSTAVFFYWVFVESISCYMSTYYLLYSTIQQSTMVKLAVINLTPVSVTATQCNP